MVIVGSIISSKAYSKAKDGTAIAIKINEGVIVQANSICVP